MHTLTQKDCFLDRFEDSVKSCWDMPALTEFRGESLSYGQLAEILEKNALVWKAAGLKPEDKVILNAKSCVNWVKAYWSAQIGGFIPVQLFNGFAPKDIENLTIHSEGRILYTERHLFEKMNFEHMPDLIAVFDTVSGDLLASRGNFAECYARRDELFAQAHPDGWSKDEIKYPTRELESTAAIMYTSGSTGNPKGVMLKYMGISANLYIARFHYLYQKGDNFVSVLPYAHIFGLLLEMSASLCNGMNLVVLSVPPVPANIKPALRQYKPKMFFCVPLVLSKMVEETIGEFIHSKSGAAKLADYENNPDFCEALHDIFMKALGGNVQFLMSGAAKLADETEQLFLKKLKVPLVIGYGMTETSGLISIAHVGRQKIGECGEWLDEMLDLKIESSDPEHIPGEILVRGIALFGGYYKNPEGTAATFTEDGWLRTGDLAVVDKDQTLFLSGRCKSMLLSSNGQNIYPEEIEVILNTLTYVEESLIVSRNGKLIALIVPKADMVADMNGEALANVMEANIEILNTKIPQYSQISGYELCYEPFTKTPKGSIRRFMYK